VLRGGGSVREPADVHPAVERRANGCLRHFMRRVSRHNGFQPRRRHFRSRMWRPAGCAATSPKASGFSGQASFATLTDFALGAGWGRFPLPTRPFLPQNNRAPLAALDAGGKDGTVNHVFAAFNPQGASVIGFKQPTPLELEHDFLWRIHRHAPPKGGRYF
jgi:Polyphosphate kinase 2 (PPK2)